MDALLRSPRPARRPFGRLRRPGRARAGPGLPPLRGGLPHAPERPGPPDPHAHVAGLRQQPGRLQLHRGRRARPGPEPLRHAHRRLPGLLPHPPSAHPRLEPLRRVPGLGRAHPHRRPLPDRLAGAEGVRLRRLRGRGPPPGRPGPARTLPLPPARQPPGVCHAGRGGRPGRLPPAGRPHPLPGRQRPLLGDLHRPGAPLPDRGPQGRRGGLRPHLRPPARRVPAQHHPRTRRPLGPPGPPPPPPPGRGARGQRLDRLGGRPGVPPPPGGPRPPSRLRVRRRGRRRGHRGLRPQPRRRRRVRDGRGPGVGLGRRPARCPGPGRAPRLHAPPAHARPPGRRDRPDRPPERRGRVRRRVCHLDGQPVPQRLRQQRLPDHGERAPPVPGDPPRAVRPGPARTRKDFVLSEPLTCAGAVARALHAAGVRRVFGHPGGEVMDLIDALAQNGVEFVLTGHESAAAFAAGAVGRLTGLPGVCLSTLGP
ncbi:MAG: hypothetical protein FJX77_13805, partial [Armatimonadetes bacterium]|nr:hypothetical protein [Armatimonadota bacterium]